MEDEAHGVVECITGGETTVAGVVAKDLMIGKTRDFAKGEELCLPKDPSFGNLDNSRTPSKQRTVDSCCRSWECNCMQPTSLHSWRLDRGKGTRRT